MPTIQDERKRRTDARTIKTFVKSIFDVGLIIILSSSLFFTVITAVESAPDGAQDHQGQPGSAEVSGVTWGDTGGRRHIDGLAHIDSSVGRPASDPAQRRKLRSISFVSMASKKLMTWYSYAKLSLTFMMHNSCLTLLFWDTLKLLLWLVTITYWRRDSHTEAWDFTGTPRSIYRLHYGSLALTNTELCLFILGNTDIKDVLCSSLFWINMIILPPITLFIKLIFFSSLSFFDIYWLLGFFIWIKYFLLLDRIINIFHVGIERKAHRIWKIALGIFLIASAFASSMYVLQGIHPKSESDSPVVYSLTQYSELFYFAFITFSTVGYGDLTPKTIQTKLVAVCFVSCMLVWIPYEMNNFIQGVGGINRISGHISSWGPMEAFIVLIGDVDPVQLSLFISKIYYAGVKLKIIVLTNMSIESYETQINQAKLLRLSLCVIREDIGLTGNVDILHTIKAKDAATTFVLSTFKTADARKTDMRTVARVICLKKFGISSDNVVVQFCSPIGTQISLHAFGSIVNLYRFKAAAIAKNITCPGIITLVINLSLTHNALLPHDKKKRDQETSDLYSYYLTGIGKRLRTCAIPESLVGVTFEVGFPAPACHTPRQNLCSNLYTRHAYIVIGVMLGEHSYRTYHLNPAGMNYVIKEGDRAILIADSTSTASMDMDIVAAGRNSSVALRNTMITMFLHKCGAVGSGSGSATTDGADDVGHSARMLYSSESRLLSDKLDLSEHVQDVNSIVVTSVTFACRYVYDKPGQPIIAIVGYSDFVLQLLLYFEELNQFNVVLFGAEVRYRVFVACHTAAQISIKVNISLLQRFKRFLAVIDGDPMKKSDVNRAELYKAYYIYVLPSPSLSDPSESDSDLDLQTIVTYRHLKTIMQGSMDGEKGANNPYSNIFSLVELHNASNVSYLDDNRWSAWNVLDKKLDPSLSYIHSMEFSKGQFISDEMFYSLTMNTMFIHEDYAVFRILLDLVSVSDSQHKYMGVELIPIASYMHDFSKRTFGHMFNYLFEKMNKIMIGIYRV
ncbi:ion channel protein [Babesia caballi]|uniref:Ion channel protein n=1 Tax=Babesia caballi TaxID=5871 RepID=A0AAV4M1F1_BABCB|nr:ion channel protein [Babesia caballi]